MLDHGGNSGKRFSKWPPEAILKNLLCQHVFLDSDSRLCIVINVYQQSIDINHVNILKMLIHIKLIDTIGNIQ